MAVESREAHIKELQEALQMVWPIIDALDLDTLCSDLINPNFRVAMIRLAAKMNALESKRLIPERE
jgi:hypothetical protein